MIKYTVLNGMAIACVCKLRLCRLRTFIRILNSRLRPFIKRRTPFCFPGNVWLCMSVHRWLVRWVGTYVH